LIFELHQRLRMDKKNLPQQIARIEGLLEGGLIDLENAKSN